MERSSNVVKRFHTSCIVLLIINILFISVFFSNAYALVYYVAPSGNNGNSGQSWESAKLTISAALLTANEGDEIWVAQGEYTEKIVNRVIGEVAVNVALYGGFSSGDTIFSDRDFKENKTIINAQSTGIAIRITNGAGPGTRIDGFYITGGQGIHGGGIKSEVSAPTIVNNTIYNNFSNGLGAGITVWGYNVVTNEHPLISNNTIIENYAYESAGDGGGIGITYSSPAIINNIIARNYANQNGGAIAIYHDSAPTISANFILANSANNLEGGSSCNLGGGGIFASAWDVNCEPVPFVESRPVITNNIIAANGANRGGGILLMATDADVTMTNNTIVSNSGAAIHWQDSYLNLSNNLIAYNSEGLKYYDSPTAGYVISHNNIYGNELQYKNTNYFGLPDLTGIDENISSEPRMANYKIGDFHIQPDSPCVNAGDNMTVSGLATDIEDNPRIIDSTVDIGADESDGTVWNETSPVIHVSKSGDDSDGLSWATAKQTVAEGIQEAAKTGGEVWVAAGLYEEHIKPPAFVHLYGGFAGDEVSLNERDWVTHKSILDGVGLINVVIFENAGYRVSSIDGFTVRNGGVYTGGTLPSAGEEGIGGGIKIWVSGPDISNNLIERNAVGYCPVLPCDHNSNGAGVYGYLSTALLTENTIQDNEVWNPVGGEGGGVYFKLSHPVIADNIIKQNHSEVGSGISGNTSTLLVAGNTIENNQMYVSTGTISNGLTSSHGAIYCWLCPDFIIERNIIRNNEASSGAGISILTGYQGTIESNLIYDNTAWTWIIAGFGTPGYGGGVYVEKTVTDAGDIRIVNNTLVDNSSADTGGALWLTLNTDAVVLANNNIAFNSSGILQQLQQPHIVEHNNVYGNGNDYINLIPGATDTQVDPLFVNYALNDFRLSPASPCIDTGSETIVPTSHVDVVPNIRIQDGNYDGLPIIDKGAHEYEGSYSVNISPISGLITSESGGQDSFEVYLMRKPSAPVTISITSNDSTEGITDVDTLIFTPDDWYQKHIVNIFGMNDHLIDFDVDYKIITGKTVSTDMEYSSMSVPDVSVTNMENDLPAPVYSCPGQYVIIKDTIFLNGQNFVCNASIAISTEGTVKVDTGSNVTFVAPVVRLQSGFRTIPGGKFRTFH